MSIMKGFAHYLTVVVLLIVAVNNIHAQTPALQEADSLYINHNWKAAKEKYASYLGDTSKNAAAWNKLGFCNYNIGLYDDAIVDFNKTLANNPVPPVKSSAFARMSKVYAVMNKVDDATNWLTQATTMGYNSLPDLDSLPDYKNVRQSPKFKQIRQGLYEILYPCTKELHSHDFDFWIGDWDCYPTGTKLLTGHSHVESMAGGCAVLENFTSTQLYSGKSFNYYDPAKGKWEQHWVGGGGPGDRSTYVDGEYKDGLMHFTSESTNAKGQKVLGNFKFYNVDKDTVRQYLELSADGGKTYQVSYDLTYIRKK